MRYFLLKVDASCIFKVSLLQKHIQISLAFVCAQMFLAFFFLLKTISKPGADPGFSRGGRIFRKNFVGFVLGRPNGFSELSQITKKTHFDQFVCAGGNFLKTRNTEDVFRHFFWKISTKKSRFSGAHSLLKISIHWRRRRLLKVFSVRHQKLIYQNSTTGNPLGRQGVESLRGRRPPPLNPLVQKTISFPKSGHFYL